MAWKFGLQSAMRDPKMLFYSDDFICVIKDAYPKAAVHFLVLPIEVIPDLKALGREHVNLLKRMEMKGKEMVNKYGEGRKFKIGFHSMPSMYHLHMHVISDDFNSPALKTLKHWNSFNSSFFIPCSRIIYQLETLGRAVVPSEKECALLLKTTMKCHKCNYLPKHMPDLKRHILVHLQD